VRINLGHGHTAEWQQGDYVVTYRDERGREYDWLWVENNIFSNTYTFMEAWKSFYVRETGTY
jgi:hypothetical protein